jgi:hypothetical protein
VQGTLRYAYKIGLVPSDRSVKNAAEGSTFSAAVLPLVANCNPTAAETVSNEMKFGVYPSTFPDFAAVKSALESTYSCLGITCAQVGGLRNSTSFLHPLTATCSGVTPYTPQPAAPVVPDGTPTQTVHTATGRFVAAGDVSDITETHKASMRSSIATELNVNPSNVVLTVGSASVLISFEVEYPDEASATAARNTLSSKLTTPAQATNFFSDAGITVTTAPTIETRSETRVLPTGDDDLPGWGVAIIVITTVLSALLFAMMAFMYTREKAGKPIFVALAPPGGGSYPSAPKPTSTTQAEGLDKSNV